jgi:NAD(P)H-dependent FMN reductase
MTITPYAIETLPFYSADLDTDDPPPETLAFRASVTSADALLIATPEYNWSVPAVVKNALDWASRPVGAHAILGTPIAVIGSGGKGGSARAQAYLDEICGLLGATMVTEPAVAIALGASIIHADGTCDDPTVEVAVAERLQHLADVVMQGHP